MSRLVFWKTRRASNRASSAASFGGRQRLERARVLERKPERQRRLALADRARDSIDVVGRVGPTPM